MIHVSLDTKFLHLEEQSLFPNMMISLLKVDKHSSSVLSVLETICDLLCQSYQLVNGLTSLSESCLVWV